VQVHRLRELSGDPDRPGMGRFERFESGGLVVGEWSLTAAAWTDRHEHDEINRVLEGELHVTCDGVAEIVRAGELVVVPAGSRARYAAPTYARMMFVYGPSADGHAGTETTYEPLTAER
jgi:ethanolamine utilization protein EutQ (cupin superfamily)